MCLLAEHNLLHFGTFNATHILGKSWGQDATGHEPVKAETGLEDFTEDTTEMDDTIEVQRNTMSMHDVYVAAKDFVDLKALGGVAFVGIRLTYTCNAGVYESTGALPKSIMP